MKISELVKLMSPDERRRCLQAIHLGHGLRYILESSLILLSERMTREPNDDELRAVHTKLKSVFEDTQRMMI